MYNTDKKLSEGEKHKYTKRLIYEYTKYGGVIYVTRKYHKCTTIHPIDISLDKCVATNIYMEYSFNFKDKKRRADIALINGDIIKFIIEIKDTSKTKECPEPWIELSVDKVISNFEEAFSDTETQKVINLGEEEHMIYGSICEVLSQQCISFNTIAYNLGFIQKAYSQPHEILIWACKSYDKYLEDKSDYLWPHKWDIFTN